MKKTLIILSIGFLVLGFTIAIGVLTSLINTEKPSQELINFCKQDAIQAKQQFAGTEFANRPFYEYCIENVMETSPITSKNALQELLNKE